MKIVCLRFVNLGKDTDICGVVAGGLAGLTCWCEAIPKEWLGCIVGKDYIIDLCAV